MPGARRDTGKKFSTGANLSIDLLEEFPACELPFEVYLEMLSPLRPRYYSISSSPLQNERVCSITVAVLEGEARSGTAAFAGVCTNYLRRQAGRQRDLRFRQRYEICFQVARPFRDADNHGRTRNGSRAVSRIPSGTRRAQSAGAGGRPVASLLRLSSSRNRILFTKRSCAVLKQRASQSSPQHFRVLKDNPNAMSRMKFMCSASVCGRCWKRAR